MSLSAQPHITVDEEAVLYITAASGEKTDTQNDIQRTVCRGHTATSCCKDKHHRKLAISSIICGISCIGIVALINSVKAGEASNPETAEYFSRRARKFGIISITVWIAVLVFTPLLMILVSYLLTLID